MHKTDYLVKILQSLIDVFQSLNYNVNVKVMIRTLILPYLALLKLTSVIPSIPFFLIVLSSMFYRYYQMSFSFLVFLQDL